MLIGLIGEDTGANAEVAEYLARHHAFLTESFRARLESAVRLMFDIPADHRRDPMLEWISASVTDMVDSLEIDWLRGKVGADGWVGRMACRIAPALEAGEDVVIVDVRFVDEARLVMRRGGEIWRVGQRPMPRCKKSEASCRIIAHRSLSLVGTREQLLERVDAALDEMRKTAGEVA